MKLKMTKLLSRHLNDFRIYVANRSINWQSLFGLAMTNLILIKSMTNNAVHTVLESEKEAFTNHLNNTLDEDPELKDRIPVDPKEIFDAVGDGILLW